MPRQAQVTAMAYKKRQRTATKFRANKRRKAYSSNDGILVSGTNPKNYVSFSGIGFPDRLRTNLVYSDSIVLDPSAGTPNPFFQVAINDPYDPQVAIGGGQATYFDQLAAIYSRYEVKGSKITAMFSRSTVSGAGGAGIGPYICGISCNDVGGLIVSDAGQLISTPNTTFKVVGAEGSTASVVATYSQKNTFPEEQVTRCTSSPIHKWIANIFASPQGVDVEFVMNVVFIVEYNIEFSDVRYIADT